MSTGQMGIRLREALVAGDAARAVAELDGLDDAHRVELILGAALRDGRGGFAAARRYLAGDLAGAVELLAEPGGDASLDEEAAGYVVRRRAPDRWSVGGAPPPPRAGDPVEAVLRGLAEGWSGLGMVAWFADDPLAAAVDRYYRDGRIHALGPRPLLMLALRARVSTRSG